MYSFESSSRKQTTMAIQKVYRIGVDVGGTNTDCVVLRMC
jgi:activator of 2-hydroxyglutaryl-CoA dehydratase